MISVESFPYVLNEIFSQFNDASAICIEYRGLPKKTGKNRKVELLSVNGHKSVTAFTQFLKSLKANLCLDILTTANKVEPEHRRQFLQYSITRCRRLLTVTIPHRAGSHDNSFKDRTYHVFRRPSVSGRDGGETTQAKKEEILLLSHRYAWMWKLLVEELISELSCFAYIARYLSVLSTFNARQIEQTGEDFKIQINTTVPNFSALMRMLYEDQTFGETKKTTLCGKFSKIISTKHQQDISSKSLKNHFDSPTPESIEYICAKLRKLVENASDLIREN